MILIYCFQFVDTLFGNELNQIDPTFNLDFSAILQIIDISGNAMISSSVYVNSGQIYYTRIAFIDKKEIVDIIRDILVYMTGRQLAQTFQNTFTLSTYFKWLRFNRRITLTFPSHMSDISKYLFLRLKW